MKKILLSVANPNEQRIAVLKDEILDDYISHIPGLEDRRNNIYRGVVEEIGASLSACFVEIGDSKKGFLQFNEIDSRYLKPGSDDDIASRLEKGQPLLVQIIKDSRSDKGPLLSTRIKLFSNRTIVEPLPRDGGKFNISREAEPEERDALTAQREQFAPPAGMSLLVRTSGLSASPVQLAWEVHTYLLSLWERIEQMFRQMDTPGLIYHDQNISNLCVREHFDQEVDLLICDSEEATQEVRSLVEVLMPDMVERIKTVEPGSTLFDEHVLKQLDALISREISLQSGGGLVIDVAEALVAIDVNSGRARSEDNIENTALKTNLEAVNEISRQLRLRNLSGIIVIDFIDMDQSANRRNVHAKMYRALRHDRAQIHTCNSLSRFGLFEMTRQNIGRALHEAHSLRCTKCGGSGRVMKIRSFALAVLDKLRDLAMNRKNPGMITIELPTDPATYLLNELRGSISELEDNFGMDIVIIPSSSMEIPDSLMRVDKVSKLHGEKGKHSYQMQLKHSPDRNSYLDKQKVKRRDATAAITSFKPQKQMPEHASQTGIFRRLMSFFFSSSKQTGAAAGKNTGGKRHAARPQRAEQNKNGRRPKQQPYASQERQAERKDAQTRKRRRGAGRKRTDASKPENEGLSSPAPAESASASNKSQKEGQQATPRSPAAERVSEKRNLDNGEQRETPGKSDGPEASSPSSQVKAQKSSQAKEQQQSSGQPAPAEQALQSGEKTLKRTTRRSLQR